MVGLAQQYLGFCIIGVFYSKLKAAFKSTFGRRKIIQARHAEQPI
jgi:hypothetical protein